MLAPGNARKLRNVLKAPRLSKYERVSLALTIVGVIFAGIFGFVECLEGFSNIS